MNTYKVLSGLTILAAIAVGWFILNPGQTFDYVVTVADEVTQLETELAELDAAVDAGTLTVAQATEAKVRIISRLDTINDSVVSAESGKLTAAQRVQLNDGLNRLKNILITYQATLTTVDETALTTEVKARLRSGHTGSSRKLSLAVADTIDAVEDTAEEAIEDFTPNKNLDALLDTVIAEEVADGELIEDAPEDSNTNNDEPATGDVVTEDDLSENSDTDEPAADEVISEEMPTIDNPGTDETTVTEDDSTTETETTQ